MLCNQHDYSSLSHCVLFFLTNCTCTNDTFQLSVYVYVCVGGCMHAHTSVCANVFKNLSQAFSQFVTQGCSH